MKPKAHPRAKSKAHLAQAPHASSKEPQAGAHGAHFGEFLLLRKLASGGMGEVFLAKHRDGRLVVIKRVLSQHLDKQDYIDMFFAEARLVAGLRHPNIVGLEEMGEIAGDPYIALEYVQGRTMRDLIDALRAQRGALALGHVARLGYQLCEGLGYAHEASDNSGKPLNIVHRDVNPHNVLLSYSGDLKLIDFGIAKSDMTLVQTATGTIKGKFVYMSPEQSAADPLDRRSDIFSLGIVLYEVLTLENPFVRQNIVLSLEAIQRQPVAPVSLRRPDAVVFDGLLAKALAKDPKDRFQTAYEMGDALRALLESGSMPAPAIDFGALFQSMFKEHRDEEARLLSEAEARARALSPAPIPARLSSPLPDVPRNVSFDSTGMLGGEHFGDEEPTVAAARTATDLRLPSPNPTGRPAGGTSAVRVPSGLELMRNALVVMTALVIGFAIVRLIQTGRSDNPRGPGVHPPKLKTLASITTEATPIAPPSNAIQVVEPHRIAVAPAAPGESVETQPSVRQTDVERPRPTGKKRRRPKRRTKSGRRPNGRSPKPPSGRASEAQLGAATPPPSSESAPAVVGRISVRASPGLSVVANGRRVGSGQPFPITEGAGRIVLSGGQDVDYAITLEYQLEFGDLGVRIDSEPWAIVRRNGLSLGRTPQGPMLGTTHHLSLTRPGQKAPLSFQVRLEAP